MIAAVTLNPAVDVTVEIERLHPGETHRTATAVRRAGGKGVNVARVLHAQGLPAIAIAAVGGAPGKEFADEIRAAGVPHVLISADAPTRITRTLYERADGRATVFAEAGRHPGSAALEKLVDLVDDLSDVTCLVVAGSLPAGMPPTAVETFVEHARRRMLPVLVDAADAMVGAARAGATLVKGNAEEVARATGEASPRAGARALRAAGAERVVVTCGREGMLLLDDDGLRTAVPDREIRGNATGAGDAVSASLAAHLAVGAPVEEWLPRALGWAAAAVRAPLAGDLDLGDPMPSASEALRGASPCPS
ncbi:1-phosphofructokinase family hexose kinase [Microbacterium sp.]|uniref:1-phosphofructokinase family hexose kinase n=1 Tax=Microbacterium sp. TaxID=51671 RepID=UPI0009294DD8|nr:PfkB family carbohydrate kinase [Microbacterium sp.]MBN9193021.1 bifunctional hydroxymethylpyrimidine kinase/phosphomethylpyrimidine kinase [Microbacterium sp.]OJU61358.1 MAG: hypothetical protein BGO04_10705 [Microbacterium sp. 70-38]